MRGCRLKSVIVLERIKNHENAFTSSNFSERQRKVLVSFDSIDFIWPRLHAMYAFTVIWGEFYGKIFTNFIVTMYNDTNQWTIGCTSHLSLGHPNFEQFQNSTTMWLQTDASSMISISIATNASPNFSWGVSSGSTCNRAGQVLTKKKKKIKHIRYIIPRHY